MADLGDRFVGCLLGGALGDALGAPVEFLDLGEIRDRYGPDGLQEMVPAYGRRGALTDDTQMTLFTAEGLIRAWDRGSERGIWDPATMVHEAYLRWLKTQGERSAHPLFDPAANTGLAGIPELNSRRAPGGTCLGALHSPVAGTRERPLNDSKGCGGIMRVAPVGLAFAEAFALGCDTAALTHGHPSGYLPAGHFAQVIADVTRGAALPDAVAHATNLLCAESDHGETLRAVEAAVALATNGAPTAEKLETLGAGWVAEEALAIALYCALTAEDFREALILAVNHSGDSDSTGSLVGNLLGALGGEVVLPADWLAQLELRGTIADLAAQLHTRFMRGETA